MGRDDSGAPARSHADGQREAGDPHPQRGGQALRLQGEEEAKVIGAYSARVVFPKAGRYALRVYDGFPFGMYQTNCAQVHTFKSVLIVAV